MTLGQKLRFYRTAEGYTQGFVAEILHLDRSTYTFYETGKTLPSVKSLFRLSRLYGVSADTLLDESIEPVGAQEFLATYKLHGTVNRRVNPVNPAYHRKSVVKKKGSA